MRYLVADNALQLITVQLIKQSRRDSYGCMVGASTR